MKSTQIAFSSVPSIAFYNTESKPTHMQSPLYWSSDMGQQPYYKLVAYVWHPDKYLRHSLTPSMPSHTCGNSAVYAELLLPT